MTTVTVSFTTDPELRDQLDAVAGAARVTRSWLLTTIVSGWLAGLNAAAASGASRSAVANVAIAEALEGAL